MIATTKESFGKMHECVIWWIPIYSIKDYHSLLIINSRPHIRTVRWGNACYGEHFSRVVGFVRQGSQFLSSPSASTGSPFDVGWTVSELPTNGSRWVPNPWSSAQWLSTIVRPIADDHYDFDNGVIVTVADTNRLIGKSLSIYIKTKKIKLQLGIEVIVMKMHLQK